MGIIQLNEVLAAHGKDVNSLLEKEAPHHFTLQC
jgi:hypothetical protein